MSREVVLKVNITRKHIDLGQETYAKQCPIALAIIGSDVDILEANVTRDYVQWSRFSTGRWYKYRAPKSVFDFVTEVDAVDHDGNPEPFTLVIVSDQFVSERPRQLHQAFQSDLVKRRRIVAERDGRDFKDVKNEEVIGKTVTELRGNDNEREPKKPALDTRRKDPKVIRPRSSTKQPRAYARRPTTIVRET